MNKIKYYELEPSFKFSFFEDRKQIPQHPADDYYLKMSDLSINNIVALKWAKWVFFFFDEISNNIKNIEGYDLSLGALVEGSIHSRQDLSIIKKPHVLTIDSIVIKNKLDFEGVLAKTYDNELFHKNTKTHFKLKLNLDEFLVVAHLFYPGLIQTSDKPFE